MPRSPGPVTVRFNVEGAGIAEDPRRAAFLRRRYVDGEVYFYPNEPQPEDPLDQRIADIQHEIRRLSYSGSSDLPYLMRQLRELQHEQQRRAALASPRPLVVERPREPINGPSTGGIRERIEQLRRKRDLAEELGAMPPAAELQPPTPVLTLPRAQQPRQELLIPR